MKVNWDLITEPAIEISESSDIIEYLDKVVVYTRKVYYMFNYEYNANVVVYISKILFKKLVFIYIAL